MIGIGLDAVTEELFRQHAHRRAGRRAEVGASTGRSSPTRGRSSARGRSTCTPWSGSARPTTDLVGIFCRLRDQQIFSYLFCFNPEPDSRMADAAQVHHHAMAAGPARPAPGRDPRATRWASSASTTTATWSTSARTPPGRGRRRRRWRPVHDQRLPGGERRARLHPAVRLLPAHRERSATSRSCPTAEDLGRDPRSAARWACPRPNDED